MLYLALPSSVKSASFGLTRDCIALSSGVGIFCSVTLTMRKALFAMHHSGITFQLGRPKRELITQLGIGTDALQIINRALYIARAKP